MKKYKDFINESNDWYDIDNKLYLLKSYIKIIKNSISTDNIQNKDIMIKYFIIIHNFLIIEKMFTQEIILARKELNKYLYLEKLNNIEDINKKFLELYNPHHNVRFSVETFDSIEPIRIWLNEHRSVYNTLLLKK